MQSITPPIIAQAFVPPILPPADSVAAIEADILQADIPLTMPGYWAEYRRLVSPRLHCLFRDPRVREAINSRLWRRWSSRAAELAMGRKG